MGDDKDKKEDCRRKMIAAKGWVSRAAENLEGGLKDKVDSVALKQQMTFFREKLSKFDDAQSRYEESLTVEAEILESIRIANEYRGEKIQVLVRAEREMNCKSAVGKGAVSKPESAKLPRLELPKFGGEILDWQVFWDQFVAVVDNSDMPKVTKFTYLQSLLYDEAKTVISGLATTETNYVEACKLLKERYDRRDRIIFAHIQALLNLAVPDKTSSTTELWKTLDTLVCHVRSLETLDISGKQYGVLLTPIVLSRLPADIRIEWARKLAGKESDLDALLKFLKEEIQCRERSETYKEGAAESTRQGSVMAFQTTSSSKHSGTKSTQPLKCGVCSKKHATHKCWEILNINVSERKDKIRSAKLCFRCLKGDHIARNCDATCVKCKGRHHILLCGGKAETSSGNQNNSTSGRGRQHGQNPNFNPARTVDTSSSVNLNPSVTGNSAPSSAETVPYNQSSGYAPLAPSHSLMSVQNVHGGTVLQTMRVFVRGKKGLVRATALLDTGSDRSYISSSLAVKAGLEPFSKEHVRYQAFGSGDVSGCESRVYDVQLEGLQGGLYNIRAAEIPLICTPMARLGVPSDLMSAFGPLRFADSYSENRNVTIDLLIGLDCYWRFMKAGIIRIPGLVAQETVFGWVVSGTWPSEHDVVNVVPSCTSVSLCCLNDIPEESLRKFWDLESVGILPESSEMKESDRAVQENFSKTVQYSPTEKRYGVCIPWKKDPSPSQLLNNKVIALSRLKVLDKHLDRNPVLKERYNAVFGEMETTGIITEVPDSDSENGNPVYYLPHRPVIREASVSTKIRPVFDASAKGFNGISLNDCVHAGPSLHPDLTSILLRFRRWQIGLSADVTKAFLQIKLRDSRDQDLHRFFLTPPDGGKVRTMKFLRVPFGNKSSPYLLNATVKHHLSRCPPSPAIVELDDNMFVDDWLSGDDDDESVCSLFKQGESIMNQAGMSFAKCSSNSEVVSDMFLKEYESKHLDADSVKILGLKWSKLCDCFGFDGIEVSPSIQLTKRHVLSFVARLFDPLGLLSPYVMTIKVLFQQLWKLGLGWEDELPVDLAKHFKVWLDGLVVLKQWDIPRCYFPGTKWRHLQGLEVHVFCDAADQRGYGACAYLRIPTGFDGTYRVSYVLSKARVAPIRPITIPRLELLGALLGARLLRFVYKALKLPDSVRYKCWSDSTIALSWIKGEPSQWKVFVANRVREICSLTDPALWFHCPGETNPADLVTRGITAGKLVTSKIWLSGPEWLSKGESKVMLSRFIPVGPETFPDEENDLSLMSVTTKYECLLPFERWGSFGKTVRIVAYVQRCVGNLKVRGAVRVSGELSQTELDCAEVTVFSCVQHEFYQVEISSLEKGSRIPRSSSLLQLSPFLGGDGLLRVGTRLRFSELAFEEKYPIILPKCHVTLLLVREKHLSSGHAGVSTLMTILRSKYWIVGLRSLAKKVKRMCVPNCKILDAKPCGEPIAPLPALRVKEAPVFTVIGIDFAGPVYCLEFPNRKLYILLFTCAVVRAVHLELTDSLSLPDFMLALRRFVARRGLPSSIFSDNAQTFVAASERLRAALGANCPKWIRIIPLSPFWGGWWERLVRSCKLGLKRSVGKHCLSRKELETTLIEVEACVNSRPLTTVGDSPDSLTPLTPNHFLIGRTHSFQPVVDIGLKQPITSSDLRAREQRRLQLLQTFWSVWSSDYLRNLPPTLNRFKKHGDLKQGSVVMIKEDNLPRMKWPLGVVLEMYPGRDNVCRSVRVRTAKGIFVRPIQRLYDLEISQDHALVSAHKRSDVQRTPSDVRSDSAIQKVDDGDNSDSGVRSVDSVRKVLKPSTTRSGRVYQGLD